MAFPKVFAVIAKGAAAWRGSHSTRLTVCGDCNPWGDDNIARCAAPRAHSHPQIAFAARAVAVVAQASFTERAGFSNPFSTIGEQWKAQSTIVTLYDVNLDGIDDLIATGKTYVPWGTGSHACGRGASAC